MTIRLNNDDRMIRSASQNNSHTSSIIFVGGANDIKNN
jgi:hypothetical protein